MWNYKVRRKARPAASKPILPATTRSFPLLGGDAECRTGNGKMGQTGRTDQCGPFGLSFLFLSDILHLHPVVSSFEPRFPPLSPFQFVSTTHGSECLHPLWSMFYNFPQTEVLLLGVQSRSDNKGPIFSPSSYYVSGSAVCYKHEEVGIKSFVPFHFGETQIPLLKSFSRADY